MNIAQIIEQGRQVHPDRAALIFEGEIISYDKLDKRSCQAAHTLQVRGVGAGDRGWRKRLSTVSLMRSWASECGQ